MQLSLSTASVINSELWINASAFKSNELTLRLHNISPSVGNPDVGHDRAIHVSWRAPRVRHRPDGGKRSADQNSAKQYATITIAVDRCILMAFTSLLEKARAVSKEALGALIDAFLNDACHCGVDCLPCMRNKLLTLSSNSKCGNTRFVISDAGGSTVGRTPIPCSFSSSRQ